MNIQTQLKNPKRTPSLKIEKFVMIRMSYQLCNKEFLSICVCDGPIRIISFELWAGDVTKFILAIIKFMQ